MSTWIQLIKREYWEHKVSFVKLPLIITVLIVGLVLTGSLYQLLYSEGVSFGISMSIDSDGKDVIGHTISSEQYEMANWVSLTSLSGLFSIIVLIVSFSYLLGSLYNDRVDRSILFWKSMPVSDLQTVCSKFLTAAIIPPLIGFIAILVTHLGLLIIFTFVTGFSSHGFSLWSSLPLFSFSFASIGVAIINFLWLAPIAAWALLVSSYVKKSPAMYALLIPIVVIAAEALSFKSALFVDWLSNHINLLLFPFNIKKLTNHGHFEHLFENPFAEFMDYLLSSLGSADLWIGVIITIAMLALAVNFRSRISEI